MSALLNNTCRPRLKLKERDAGEVMRARPTAGDHKKIVRAAAFEAAVKHRELFVELSKI